MNCYLEILTFGFGVTKTMAKAIPTTPELRAVITPKMQANPANMVHNTTLGVVRKGQKPVEIQIFNLQCVICIYIFI